MLPWLIPSLLLGCQEDPISDYELTLVPVFLESQADDILDLEPAIKVRLVYPEAEPEILFAGIASEGDPLTLPALPPIPADTLVQLIAEEQGGEEDEWDPAITLAYGEAVLTEALALGQKKVELSIEMARTDTVGEIGSLRNEKRRIDAAVAVVDGAAYVFGGGDPATRVQVPDSDTGAVLLSSSAILRAEHTSTGWSTLSEVGTIEPFDAQLGFLGASPQEVNADRRSGMSATPVDVGGSTSILVAGGRYSDWPAWLVDGWFLWDPVTNETTAKGSLTRPRADHLAFRLGENKVLIYGGTLGVSDSTPSYEIWKASTSRSEVSPNVGSVRTGGIGAAGTELGDAVAICGGFTSVFETYAVRWTPSAACHRITGNDSLEDLEPLPIAVGSAALAQLPDGGLLLTGGVDQEITEEANGSIVYIFTATVEPATNRAFRWDPDADAWSEVDRMKTARAHHAAITLPTGKVLIVGGTGTGSSFFGPITDPVQCSELFDPETDTFTEVGCSEAGRGGGAAVGRGGDDFFVLEGGWYEGFYERAGGASYGIVRTIPE